MRQGGTYVSGDPWAAIDGRLNAPCGTPSLFPHLFDLNSPGTQYAGRTYVVRPPYHVPGVDYGVGYNVCQFPTLADPVPGFPTTGQASLAPALRGVTNNFDGVNVLIGDDNFTVEGFDFGLHNGINVAGTPNNLTIRNNKFTLGTNNNSGSNMLALNAGFSGTTNGQNLTILNNIIDDPIGVQMGTIGIGLLTFNYNGNIDIRYNLFRNAWGELIVSGLNTSATAQPDYHMNFKYNVLQNQGLSLGAGGFHGDMWQQQAQSTTMKAYQNFEFNLFMQDQVGSGQGMAVGFLNNQYVTFRGNVLIATAGNATDAINFGCNYAQDWNNGVCNVTYNYADWFSPPPFTTKSWFDPHNQGGTAGTFTGILNQSNNFSLTSGNPILIDGNT